MAKTRAEVEAEVAALDLTLEPSPAGIEPWEGYDPQRLELQEGKMLGYQAKDNFRRFSREMGRLYWLHEVVDGHWFWKTPSGAIDEILEATGYRFFDVIGSLTIRLWCCDVAVPCGRRSDVDSLFKRHKCASEKTPV